MSRYIDVDILENELQFLYQLLDWDDGGAEKTAFGVAIRKVHETPTADVRENVRGKWIPVTNGRGGNECDKCHAYAPAYQTGKEHLTNFCPNCGADMRGENT